MTLHIGDAIGDGTRRAFTPTGAVLMAMTFVYQLGFLGATNALFLAVRPVEARESSQFAFAFPLSPAAAAAVMALAMLVGVYLYVVATRAMTRDRRELASVPTTVFTRRIGRATLSALGANLVVVTAVTVGFVLLVVPGVYLAVSFLFVVFAIGVEDARAVDALRRSWTLATGHRWRLLALALIVGAVTAIGSGLGTVLRIVSPLAGQLTSMALTAVFSIVAYGIIADAYLQLRDAEPPVGRPASRTPAGASEPLP